MAAVIDAIDVNASPGVHRDRHGGIRLGVGDDHARDPSFTESGGVITMAGAPKSGVAANTGTAAVARIKDGGGNVIVNNLSVGTSGSDVNLNSTSISTSQTVTSDVSARCGRSLRIGNWPRLLRVCAVRGGRGVRRCGQRWARGRLPVVPRARSSRWRSWARPSPVLPGGRWGGDARPPPPGIEILLRGRTPMGGSPDAPPPLRIGPERGREAALVRLGSLLAPVTPRQKYRASEAALPAPATR